MHGQEWQSGPVRDMEWTGDGFALAVAQEQGGLSVWSVFGSSLMSTSADHIMARTQEELDFCGGVQSLSWGPSGYHLITVPAAPAKSPPNPVLAGDVYQFQFFKSALTTNASLPNQFNVLLLGDDRLCLNAESSSLRVNGNVDKLTDVQWQMIQIPENYMSMNWPMRSAAMDPSGQYVAIAGERGFAHYSTVSRKWRMFGNEAQEQSFCCRGLAWWRNFIVVACNDDQHGEEIRLYPRGANLDKRHISLQRSLSRRVVLLNVFSDYVILTTSTRRTLIFKIVTDAATGVPTDLTLEWEVAMQEYVFHWTSLVSVALVHLGNDVASTTQDEPGALIVNVAGKLSMISLERTANSKKAFGSPALLATGVESYWGWVPNALANSKHKHLSQALWLGCGGRGMQVWLPLESVHTDESQADHSDTLVKRVMLPFELNVYPLSVLFEDAVVLGASHEAYYSIAPSQKFPYCALERKTQIYLHHILRQLLRRNHDAHALAMARASSSLPYFPHVLELMIHEVLEDEAHQSGTPRPDAQLPHVVEFLGNFGSLLDTIVHCARKTEVAKWAYFFSIVGNPKALFEECIKTNQLETAASYLIILQSLESPTASRKYAVRLVRLALDAEKWELAKDLNRFLKATASYENETTVSSPSEAKENGTIVFSDYALTLLTTCRLRALAKLAGNLGFPLVAWLYSIRNQSGGVKEIGKAIAAVGIEFKWNSVDVTACVGNGLTTPPETLQKRQEMEHVLNVLFEAHLFDWAFVFCVLLQDKPAANRVLEEVAADRNYTGGTFAILKRFQQAVETLPATCHREFLASISTNFRSAIPESTDIERDRHRSSVGVDQTKGVGKAEESDCVVS